MGTLSGRARAAIALVAVMTMALVPVARAQDGGDGAQTVLDWNTNTLAAAGTAGIPPAVTNLYMAMVHGAMHDAVNAVAGRYQPYLGGLESDPSASPAAAAAAAAHGVLAGSFPDQAEDLQAKLDTSLGRCPTARPRTRASPSARPPRPRCSPRVRETAEVLTIR